MAKTTNEMKLQLWMKHIPACKQSGLTVHEYCAINNLSEKSYWYYHRKLSKAIAENMPQVINDEVHEVITVEKEGSKQFLELSKPKEIQSYNKQSYIEIEKDGFRIKLQEGFEQNVLLQVVQVLKNV